MAVVNEALLEAMNTIVSAISSGVASWFNGTLET
jgi:hypothetical protein